MSLNAKKLPFAGGDRVAQPDLEPGVYPARVVQVLDLGLQNQNPVFVNGQRVEKKPANMINITYELVDAFMVDEDGNELEDKPRWVSEMLPFYSLNVDNATSTKRYRALDPEEKYDGDFGLLLNTPCNVTITINKKGDKVYTNVASVAAMRPRDAEKCEELKNDTKLFSLDEPDMEVFYLLPQWLQDKIKGNLNFKGSALEKAIEENPKPEKEAKKDESKKEEKPKRVRQAPKVEEEEPPFDADDDDVPY